MENQVRRCLRLPDGDARVDPPDDGGCDAVGQRQSKPLRDLVAGLLFGLAGAYAAVTERMAGEFNGHILVALLASLLAFLIAGLGTVGLRQPRPQAGGAGR